MLFIAAWLGAAIYFSVIVAPSVFGVLRTLVLFFFNDTATTKIYTLSLHDALPICMGDAGIKSAIQGSNVPNPDEAVPSFVSGAMAKAGKGLLEGTLQAGTSAVSDKLLDLVGLGGKSNQIKQLIRKDRKSGSAGMPR